jgi:hypothetical protein
MKISGVAAIPDVYKSEGDKQLKLRLEDIESAIRNSDYVPFQMTHSDDSDEIGKAFALRVNSDGGLYYGAEITNLDAEGKIKESFDSGGIPNVSVKMMPTEDATIEVDDDGIYTASDWKLEHVAIVERGRCSPEKGCGIFDYQILNSSIGEINMTEDTTVDQLKLELTELNKTVEAKDSRIGELESSVKDLELALEEANTAINEFKEAELDAIRNDILKLDDTIDSAEIKTIEDKAALGLMLSNIRERASRKTKAATEKDEPTLDDVMNEFKAAAYRI